MLTKADRVGSGKADQRNTSSAVRLGSFITGRDWQLARSRKRIRYIALVAILQRSVLQGSTVPELDTLTPPRAHRSPLCVRPRAGVHACLVVGVCTAFLACLFSQRRVAPSSRHSRCIADCVHRSLHRLLCCSCCIE
jgi:hypothetical protein